MQATSCKASSGIYAAKASPIAVMRFHSPAPFASRRLPELGGPFSFGHHFNELSEADSVGAQFVWRARERGALSAGERHGTFPSRDCCTRDRRFAAGRRAVDAGLVGGVRWRGLVVGPDSAKSAASAVSGWLREPDVGQGHACGAESCAARHCAPRFRVALFRLLHRIV